MGTSGAWPSARSWSFKYFNTYCSQCTAAAVRSHGDQLLLQGALWNGSASEVERLCLEDDIPFTVPLPWARVSISMVSAQ
jgi:hypothetical protein